MREMRRTICTIAALAVLVVPASALADGAGHNPATRKLEASFSRSLCERVGRADGCYPAPTALAKTIAKTEKLKTAVARNLKGVKRKDVVYVVRSGSSCNNVRLSLRDKSGLYVMDSTQGEIKVVGGEARRARQRQLAIANRGPLRGLSVRTKSVGMNVANRRDRLDVECAGKSYPLGGGMSQPPIGANGQGVYPQSFQRLGAQRGWHITAWLYDPLKTGAESRTVTLQTICAKGLVPETAPHRTTFIKPGETGAVVASCPKGQVLMSGGFQRTDFLAFGGDWVTESRAISARQWRVTGSAHGIYGGEMTAIAYCIRSKKPLLTEVAASAPLPAGAPASATTPACPGGTRLTSGGFSGNGSSGTWFAGGFINPGDTWTATAYQRFGGATTLTAYGYCLQPGK
jgi:hypothetical protein